MFSRQDRPIRYVGFDSGGEVFLSQGRVFRGIYSGNGDLYRRVLDIFETNDLFQFGVIPTRESRLDLHEHLAYDLVLEHERVPFISYPHEWAASMLKDAALFHVELYMHLAPYGLTIKDWHPYNILFRGAAPVFVDFASIVPQERLFDEVYLTPPRVPRLFRRVWDKASAYTYEMYRRMCVPYFLLPLYLMHFERHAYARRRLLETVMNASRTLVTEVEVFSGRPKERALHKRENVMKCVALMERGASKRSFWNKLHSEVSSLSVSPKASNYSSYYVLKGEVFEYEPSTSWAEKQRTVDNTIRRLKPATVLDIGSNTGWFSIMAANHGCQVVALDVDESCVDLLYQRAKSEGLAILPLVEDFTQPTRELSPLVFEDEQSLSQIGEDFPLIQASIDRLQCDMVLVLAIVHHLSLGHGLRFDQIVGLLSSYTKKWLVVEFITKDDKLIAEDIAFFPSYFRHPQGYEWYTLEAFAKELTCHFRSVEVLPSHPDSRSIFVCTK